MTAARPSLHPACPRPSFAHVLESTIALPEQAGVRSFAELLFRDDPSADVAADPTIVVGTQGERLLEVTLRGLRRAALVVDELAPSLGLGRGDTVCLVRLPRTSEAEIAAALIAMNAWGLRVLLPMAVEPARFGEWLRAAGVRRVFWAAAEVRQRSRVEADVALLDRLEAGASALAIPTSSLDEVLAPARLGDAAAAPGAAHPRVRAMIGSTSGASECLLVTTSGTSGHAKLVRFQQRAFLRSCASWEAAGLLAPERLGGRGLCLLLAHTMGIRALWNALWTRRPLCVIPPEWYEEQPERARAFLLHMRPEHITGGPAAFRTLVELARALPDLRTTCLAALRCAVSSGVPFDGDLGRRLADNLGLRIANAFGTTETQQVLSTLAPGPLAVGDGALGNLLPGARAGLERLAGQPVGTYRLHVASPFAGLGDGSDGEPEWIATGDLVTFDGNGVRHVGRESDDFVKDGFGVKIPRRRIDELWSTLGPTVVHLETFPLAEEPGLAALIFVPAGSGGGSDGEPTADPELLRRVRGLILGRLETLRRDLDELEFRHLAVVRFACLLGEPPRTPKGSVARAVLAARHATVRATLCARRAHAPWIVRLDRAGFAEASAVQTAAPRIGRLIRLARLDKDFVAARGDRLTYREDGSEREVLDLVGGFGSNLLGHRHPEVLEAARSFLDGAMPPLGEQGSAGSQRGELARRLSEAVGRVTGDAYVVRLGSTGSEVVEMALAHAHLEREEAVAGLLRRQRQRFGARFPDAAARITDEARALLRTAPVKVLALEGAFHGTSLGARSVLGAEKRRLPYAAMSGIEPIFLPRDGSADLARLVGAEALELPCLVAGPDGEPVRGSARFSRIIAAIAEPVLGEGGVHEVAPALLAALGQQSFPLILDEIQCGLGRCGRFLASGGLPGAYYVLGKALGGGLAKLSSLLVPRQRYLGRFDEHYTSTFAGDPLSSAVGLRVLDLIDREDVAGRAAERGERLRAALERVRARFPDVLRDVRGRGLMQAVELDVAAASRSIALRALSAHDYLGVAAAAYLFHQHDIRVLPTLSAPNVLRIEPSAWIRDADIEQLERGLAALCAALHDGRSHELLAGIVARERAVPAEAPRVERQPRIRTELEPAAPAARRVGFVNHFIDAARDLALVDPGLTAATATERLALFHTVSEIVEARPILGFARNLLGDRLWFLSVVNTVDAATLEAARGGLDRELFVERIQESVDLAAAQGATVVALGAFASILTDNGLSIQPPPGVRIVTGNTLTVAVAARRVREACRKAALALSSSVLGLVGATGNIGAALAHRLLLGEDAFDRAVLVAPSPERREALRADLRARRPDLDLEVTANLGALSRCQVIALTVSAAAPILEPRHLGPARPLVIGDVSVPSAVARPVRDVAGVQVVPLAGYLVMPGEPDFVMGSQSPAGTVYACAAEAMLVALEPQATADLTLVGDVDPASVDVLERLAVAHRFLTPIGAES